MSEAVDVLHAIEKLQLLAVDGPGPDADTLKDVDAILFQMGLGRGAQGYKAEKLQCVRAAFESWFGARGSQGEESDTEAFRLRLVREIEHLRKALARGSEGQD